MTDIEAAGAMSFIFEAGMLKRAKRTGWLIAGLDDPGVQLAGVLRRLQCHHVGSSMAEPPRRVASVDNRSTTSRHSSVVIDILMFLQGSTTSAR